MTTSFVLCIVSGLFSIVLGWLILTKGWYHFLSSLQPEAYKRAPEKFAKLFGYYAIFIGILTACLPFGLEFIGSHFFIFYIVCTLTSLFYIFFKLQSLIR